MSEEKHQISLNRLGCGNSNLNTVTNPDTVFLDLELRSGSQEVREPRK